MTTGPGGAGSVARAVAVGERPAPAGERAVAARGSFPFLRSPWRRPYFLRTFTWLYLAWSILPVAIAVLFSFNAGRSRSAWQGFSIRWYWGDPLLSVWHDPTLHAAFFQTLKLAGAATLISVPLGVAFAIGIDRWHGRLSSQANFQMLLSFVLPELVIGVALLLVFTTSLHFIALGTSAQILGLITFQMSYPVIIVRARMLSIGMSYEEAGMDLGCSPAKAVRRVLLPMLYPAIMASAVLVFADCIDDFVIVRYLSSDASTEPMSVKIYSSARAAPTPALNALATIMLGFSVVAILLGFLVYRHFTKGERGSAIGDFAGQL